jgi:nitroreductase
MNDHLNWRYTTKKFDPAKKISESEFESLLEALRLAPSSYGLQPWKFVVVRDVSLRNRIKIHAHGQAQVIDASHLIVFCALRTMDAAYIGKYVDCMAEIRGVERKTLEGFDRSMQEFLKSQTPLEMSEWMKRQVYIPLGMFLSECAHRKIDACPMEGFDISGVDRDLGLEEEGVTALALCAVGYRAADDRFAGLKKVRFEIKELFIDR